MNTLAYPFRWLTETNLKAVISIGVLFIILAILANEPAPAIIFIPYAWFHLITCWTWTNRLFREADEKYRQEFYR